MSQVRLLATGIVAHLKQRRLTSTNATWPSMNVLLTSYGWHNVYTHGGLPIAVGERLLVGDDAVRLLDVVRPVAFTLDVVGCGGLTRAIDLVAVARAAGVPVYPHGRSLVPAVHLAAAFPETVVAVEYQLQWEPVRRSLYAESWLPQLGQLSVPASPGLGATPRSG